MSELDKYVPMIDAIIIASNPDEVSPKKIRKAIQELFAVNLDSKRKTVNELIVERFHEIQKQPRVIITKEALRENDEAIAKSLQREVTQSSKRSKTSKEKKEKKKRRKPDASSNSINVRKVLLSEPLKEFLGEPEMPRTQVVKKVWNYIKEHDLQNPSDRREILCDKTMEPIFGKKMTMFTLNKILAKHLFNKDDLISGSLPKEDVEKKKVKLEADSMIDEDDKSNGSD